MHDFRSFASQELRLPVKKQRLLMGWITLDKNKWNKLRQLFQASWHELGYEDSWWETAVGATVQPRRTQRAPIEDRISIANNSKLPFDVVIIIPKEDYDEYLKGANEFARIYSVCAPACVDLIQSEHFGDDHVEPILYMEEHGDAQYVVEEFRYKTPTKLFKERYTLDP